MSLADYRFVAPAVPQTIGAKLLRVNWPLLALLCVIACVGLMALYAAAGGNFSPWADRHALRFVLALGLLIVIALTPLRWWLTLAVPTYALALLLLLLVPLLGTEALGARRWLSVAGVSFQPAELMKVALVLVLARYYQWLAPQFVSRPHWVLLPVLLIALPVILTLRQPDLGTAVLFAAVGLALMFLAGVNVLYFAGSAVVGGLVAPLIWNRLHDYQRRRIEIFLDPEKDPLGAGYHITQSKIALGSGGVSGKGFLQGTQGQLNFLPEKHTDFIFTTLAEEWGFTGAIGVLGLYVLLFALVLAMALRCRNQFGRLVGAGAGAIIFLYAFINVAMVTGLVPVVGVPLPLISYGGTSMTTIMVALGIAMCAHVNRGQGLRSGE
jgi:rod shape determining protein RodA